MYIYYAYTYIHLNQSQRMLKKTSEKAIAQINSITAVEREEKEREEKQKETNRRRKQREKEREEARKVAVRLMKGLPKLQKKGLYCSI